MVENNTRMLAVEKVESKIGMSKHRRSKVIFSTIPYVKTKGEKGEPNTKKTIR